jgi:hypothetical protein
MSDVVDVSPLHSRLEVRTYPQLAQLRGLRRAPRTKVAPNSGSTAGTRRNSFNEEGTPRPRSDG